MKTATVRSFDRYLHDQQSDLQKRYLGSVECASAAMAAVTMSPPQVSSIFIGIPLCAAKSLIARARVKPPTYSTLEQ